MCRGFSLHCQHNVKAHFCVVGARKLNITEPPLGSSDGSKFTWVETVSAGTHIQIKPVTFKIIWLFSLRSRLPTLRSICWRNLRDVDKLPPDRQAAQTHIIHVAEQRKKVLQLYAHIAMNFMTSVIKSSYNMQEPYKKTLYIINTPRWKLTNCSRHYIHPPDTQRRAGACRWEFRTFCSEPQLLWCHRLLPAVQYPRQYT